ncbi:hypothetical protein M3223_08810 [Paenibacillus pasadenensis]|uniref:phage tail terminator family protein n=1 Tax=Paenibacillus pasadenensis TaxID=217090 RepID=UPI00203C0A37|nr:hypothetical protein [Paenibacillus pasadenensis]MCM3747454.1 hypothetical protein [Paenibacillus pasadenensis]
MITVNDVKDGVVRALVTRWPDWAVYDEPIQQGLKEPCFRVQVLPITQTSGIGRRRIRSHSVAVAYFGLSDEDRHAVGAELLEVLERIDTGSGLATGSGMQYQIVDDVLQMSVQYSIHLMRARAEPQRMQKLKEEIKLEES